MKMNFLQMARQYMTAGKRLDREIFEDDFIRGMENIIALHPDYVERDSHSGAPTFTVYSVSRSEPDSIRYGHMFYRVTPDKASISGYDVTDKGRPGFGRRAYDAARNMYEKSNSGHGERA